MSRADVDAAKWQALFEKAGSGDGLKSIYRGRAPQFVVLLALWAAIVGKVYSFDEFTAIQLVMLIAATTLFISLADSGAANTTTPRRGPSKPRTPSRSDRRPRPVEPAAPPPGDDGEGLDDDEEDEEDDGGLDDDEGDEGDDRDAD